MEKGGDVRVLQGCQGGGVIPVGVRDFVGPPDPPPADLSESDPALLFHHQFPTGGTDRGKDADAFGLFRLLLNHSHQGAVNPPPPCRVEDNEAVDSGKQNAGMDLRPPPKKKSRKVGGQDEGIDDIEHVPGDPPAGQRAEGLGSV